MRYDVERLVRRLLVLLITGSIVVAGCARGRQSARDDEKKVDPVSQTAPKLEPMPRTAPVIAQTTPVPSRGDCAPKYANGLVGTCINNEPCRGFGVLAANGKAVCACYAKAGGCGQDERCDAIKKACVPEKEPGFGRAPED